MMIWDFQQQAQQAPPTPARTLFLAAGRGDAGRVRGLLCGAGEELPRGAPLEQVNGQNCFHAACKKGWVEVTGFLIASGAKVNHISRDGITALLMAAMHGHTECVCLLLTSGANVHHKMLNVSALDLATNAKKTNIVELLKAFIAIHPAAPAAPN
jgi:ankyrin repeat protein